MKRTSGLLFLCSTLWMVAACAASDPADVAITIQNVGLSSVTVPPSGEGVAPVIGSPGDGAAVVTRIGGWSGGPGAVQWHGGQWIVPYQAQPGGVLANMFCDVKPNATSTDLVELVGSNGVIGSTTVPATTNNVIIRAWILPSGGYTVHDGEHLVIRHSPRDSTTGAWTGATQDLTIISCAVNTTSGVASPNPLSLTYITVPSQSFAAPDGNNMQIYPITVADGTKIVTASVAATCPFLGWITACVRIREVGTWTWCSAPTACVSSGSATAPLPASPLIVDSAHHVDLALMSGPSLATSPFGVFTIQ